MPELITREMSVREAIARYPGAEAIFGEHGLGGCGGPDGPQEPIGFFAAIHHVDADALVAALNRYAREQARPADRAPAPAQPMQYRWFLATALALTLGAGISSGIAAAMTGGGWGALRGESWLALVQTHGHLQLFGFVVLFIAGVALHVLPRFKRQPPLPAGPVYATFALLAGGVLLRALAQPHAQGWLRGPFVASSVLELAGGVLFAALVLRVLALARSLREPLDYFVAAASAALVAVLAMNVQLTADAVADGRRVISGVGNDALLIGATQAFVVMFVVGIASRVLPFFLGLQRPHTRLLQWTALALAGAVALRVVAMWLPEVSSVDTTALERAGAFGAALAIIAAVAGLRVFEASPAGGPAPEAPPAFGLAVRLAFGWLIAAALLDAYWQLREIEDGATPMYAAGAVRHAYLLGFATLMIMAMGYRIVPVFSGPALRWPAGVTVSIALVAAAAVLRIVPVAFTTAPAPLDYKLMTAGGVLLFAGMSIFGWQIGRSMFGWRFPARRRITEIRPAAEAPAVPAGSPPQTDGMSPRVTAEMTVAQALDVHPAVLQLLLQRGFGPLAQPETRRAMAPTVTLERAASFVGATPDDLVRYVNDGIARAMAEGAAGVPAAGDEGGIGFTLIETAVGKEAVLEALGRCYDPEVPVNIVDLGLVYDVLVRGSYARVTMSMTSPGCPAADMLEADVRAALAAVPGVDTVDVEVVEEPAWTPARIAPAARARLGMA